MNFKEHFFFNAAMSKMAIVFEYIRVKNSEQNLPDVSQTHDWLE